MFSCEAAKEDKSSLLKLESSVVKPPERSAAKRKPLVLAVILWLQFLEKSTRGAVVGNNSGAS